MIILRRVWWVSELIFSSCSKIKREKVRHKSQLQVTKRPLIKQPSPKKLSGWGLEAVSIRAGLTGMEPSSRKPIPVMGRFRHDRTMPWDEGQDPRGSHCCRRHKGFIRRYTWHSRSLNPPCLDHKLVTTTRHTEWLENAANKEENLLWIKMYQTRRFKSARSTQASKMAQ